MLSGKRKSGKDSVVGLLKARLEESGDGGGTVIVGLSHSLKREFAALNGERVFICCFPSSWGHLLTPGNHR